MKNYSVKFREKKYGAYDRTLIADEALARILARIEDLIREQRMEDDLDELIAENDAWVDDPKHGRSKLTEVTPPKPESNTKTVEPPKRRRIILHD